MRIVRALVLVLVALNLLLFAAVRGCFGPSGSGEPDRLAQQITPERIRIVDAGRPDAAPAAKPNGKAKEKPVPKPEPKVPDKSEAKSEAKAESERDVDACQRYAPLSRDQAARIGTLAKTTDAQVTLSAKSLEAPTSYWVFIPPTGDRQDMDKHMDELRSAGISDWYIQPNGPDKGGISLGVFKSEPMATVLKDRLLGKGITGIRVRGRDSPGAKVAVELTARARELAALEEQITAALPGIAGQACVAAH
jgi:hypothetical protein